MSDKPYSLEERTFEFALEVRKAIKLLPATIANAEDAKQLVKASGSVGANYIEANEPLGPKDFLFRLKVCRKEVKESAYWIKLIIENNEKELGSNFNPLHQEAIELKKIFTAIINKKNS